MDFFRRNRKTAISLLAIFIVSFLGVFTTFNHADAVLIPTYYAAKVLTSGASGAGEAMGNMLVVGIKYILGAILTFVGWLLIIPGVMLDALLKVENNALYLDSTAVREVWVMVRDFLNLFFIFTLLFSAFATIFQIEKYHIKKIIVKIIIMALLVNFSFPIARFFIDISNVMMYWLLNNIFGGSEGASIAATLASSSGLKDLLIPERAAEYQVPYLIAAIIFTFIFGITLMMIAVLFLVRLIVLSVLVMFSPVGFVGYVFPDTAKYAKQWWDMLLKYSFFAPIMTFGLAVTLKMMQSLGANSSAMSSFRKAAEDNSANVGADANWIAAAAFFIVPIVILWMFMGVAQKFSIEFAGDVQKRGQDLAKWAGKQPWRGTKALVNATGVPGGVKAGIAKFQKSGTLFGVKVSRYGGTDAREAREAQWAGLMTGGSSGMRSATENRRRKLIADKMEEYKKSGLGASQIERDLTSNDEVTRIAAAMHMNEKGDLNNIDRMKKALAAVGNDAEARTKIVDKIENVGAIFENKDHYNDALVSALDGIDVSTSDGKQKADKIRKSFEAKMKKENRMDLILDHDVKYGVLDANSFAYGKTEKEIYEERLGSLNAEGLGKQHKLHSKIGTNTNLQNFILDNIAGDYQRHQEMHRHLSISNQRKYADEGFDPGPTPP